MIYSFEWDRNKAKTNITKHGISFEEAASIFKDSNAMSIFDEDHSGEEDRWITLGLSSTGKLVVVNHTFKEIDSNNSTIRIYSSRKANKSESKQYGGDL